MAPTTIHVSRWLNFRAHATPLGDDTLGDHGGFRQLRRRLAEAALAQRCGQPEPSRREVLAFFDELDEEPMASACRCTLLKQEPPCHDDKVMMRYQARVERLVSPRGSSRCSAYFLRLCRTRRSG